MSEATPALPPVTSNIASYLPRMAALQPDKPAIYYPSGRDRVGTQTYQQYSFRELDEASSRIARGLESVGIGRGVRTVLMVTPSLDFFALTFAIFKAGAVPVMVDPGIGLKSLKACLGRAKPEAFIGVTKAHVARVLFGWGRPTVRTCVTVGPRLFWGGHTLGEISRRGESNEPYVMAATDPDDIAAILFTSGSTGVPKGAVYRHGNFMAQVEAIRDMYDIQPGEIDLPTFPLFALFDPALGMTTVIPMMDPRKPASVDPKDIIEPIQEFAVTTMFGSPALLNTVGRYGEKHDVKLPTLRRVISAGAPMTDHVLRRFAAMMPEDGAIHPPYGATEALPVATMTGAEIIRDTWQETERGRGVCVGRPVDSIRVAIIPIDDNPIARWADTHTLEPGEIGEIAVQGPQVTREYFGDVDNTKLAKIEGDDGAFWHRMGDLGYLDDVGRLWFCGRKAHRVTTPDQVLYTIQVEGVFNTHPDVFRTAIVGIGPHGSQRPVLCVELEPDRTDAPRERIVKELLELGAAFPHCAPVRDVLFHEAFPVDIRHNAKIGREKLATWASGQLPST